MQILVINKLIELPIYFEKFDFETETVKKSKNHAVNNVLFSHAIFHQLQVFTFHKSNEFCTLYLSEAHLFYIYG